MMGTLDRGNALPFTLTANSPIVDVCADRGPPSSLSSFSKSLYPFLRLCGQWQRPRRILVTPTISLPHEPLPSLYSTICRLSQFRHRGPLCLLRPRTLISIMASRRRPRRRHPISLLHPPPYPSTKRIKVCYTSHCPACG